MLWTARLELLASCPKLSRLWLRGPAQVRLHRPIAGKYLVGFFIGDGSGDDDVIALFPVRRGRHAMLRGELDRIQHSNDLVEVAAGGHGIGQSKFDALDN